MLKENYLEVRRKIDEACKRVGRDPKEVTLISVGKTKPVEMLEEVYAAGSRDFGENKVQEMCDKIEVMEKDIKWHMIGHLQRNKVKYIVDKVYLIHSVDSLRLAEEIDIQAAKKGVDKVPILIEVNAAHEISKFGVSPEDVKQLVTEISTLKHVSVKGLMTVAPYVDDKEDNRAIFHQIKDLSVDIKNENIDNVSMEVLSMGMTNDYEIAVEESATLVRVGTAIFGARNYGTTN